MSFERGYHPEFLGEYAALQESRTGLIGVGALCFLGMLVLLYVEFKSVRLMLLIAASLPFALVGGVAAASPAAARCRSARSSASSRCWASPRATASC